MGTTRRVNVVAAVTSLELHMSVLIQRNLSRVTYLSIDLSGASIGDLTAKSVSIIHVQKRHGPHEILLTV